MMSPFDLPFEFSSISAAVLQVGDESLEVIGDTKDSLFCINKQPCKRNVDNGIVGVISGYPISYEELNSKQDEFIVDLGGNASITMRTLAKLVRVSIKGAAKDNFGTTRGLLGAYGTDKLLGRDDNRIFEDTNEFGQEWQVLPSDGMLFHNAEGPQAPEKCEIPTTSNIRRRLKELNVNEEEAMVVCAHVSPEVFDICVFDVMATGDKDVVGAY